jgi:hypothetical protein
MRKLALSLGAAAISVGSLLTASPAMGSQPTPVDPSIVIQPSVPVLVRPLDCNGTTGPHGCGPGWFWRNGERGWACYRC